MKIKFKGKCSVCFGFPNYASKLICKDTTKNEHDPRADFYERVVKYRAHKIIYVMATNVFLILSQSISLSSLHYSVSSNAKLSEMKIPKTIGWFGI